MREEGKDSLPSLFGRYTLVERLAMGGMAEVFKARIMSSHGFAKLLVIKRILPHLAADKTFVAMFIDEAKLTAQLIHPKIVQVTDFGEVEGQLYIALEFVDGFDALALLRAAAGKHVRLPVPLAMFITMEILDALDYAHTSRDVEGRPMKIVHRDISPSNVFIAKRGDVKLGDFGIAHAQERESKTQAGTLKGKYGYMSPEQVVGGALDGRSDLFAVGILLAEMLMGRRLFTAPNDLDVLLMVRDGRLDRLDKYGRDIPPAVDQIVRKSLAKRLTDRFQTAADFRDALAEQIFKWGFRVSPSDLGRISADFLDQDPAATARLTENCKRWDLRTPITGVNEPPSGVGHSVVTNTSETGAVHTAAAFPPPPPPSQVVISPEAADMPPPGQSDSSTSGRALRSPGSGAVDLGGGDPLDIVMDDDLVPASLPAPAPASRYRPTLPFTADGPQPVPRPPVAAIPPRRPAVAPPAVPKPPSYTDLPAPPAPSAPSYESSRVEAAMKDIDFSNLVSLDDYRAAPPSPKAPAPNAQAFSMVTPPLGMPTPMRTAPASGSASVELGLFVPATINRPPDTVADLTQVSPVRVFAGLAVAAETGLVRFELTPHIKEVYVVRGSPESVSSSLRSERFGEYLVARGHIKPEDLQRALAQMPQSATKLGDTLVAMGLIRPLDAFRLLSQQVRERVMEIFGWVQGRVTFYRDVHSPTEGFPLGLDPFEILGAGVATLPYEYLERRFAGVIDRRPRAVANARVNPDAFRLGGTPREIWNVLDGSLTIRDWMGRLVSPDEMLTFLRTIFLLVEAGLVEFP